MARPCSCFTRRGHDWTDRYPAIAAVAAKLRARSFTLDGEAAVSGLDGVAVFEALHRRRAAPNAVLHAFDCWSSTAKTCGRCRSASARRSWRGCWPAQTAGIVYNEHTDEDGVVVFQHACRFGLEGIVSKRLSAPYRSGPSRDWVKVKNPDSPAMQRAREGRW
jgi:bifunctional non-homologous end joining protein LigD